MEKDKGFFILCLLMGLLVLFLAGAYLGCMIEKKFGNPTVCCEGYV